MQGFESNGPAALADIRTSEWRNLFSVLEQHQGRFLQEEPRFRSAEYLWPRDPLHTWSRVWEYPYVYHHLERWRNSWRGTHRPHVADIGSGVTFFPFVVADLGCEVSCTDVDPVCEADLGRAAAVLESQDRVEFRLAHDGLLPFRDHEFDAAYCVSVLEHIPKFERTVAEIARIVRPGALVLITVDLDLSGRGELSPSRHRDLLACLNDWFEPAAHWREIPRRAQLRSCKGPYPHRPSSAVEKFWFCAKQRIKPLLGRVPTPLVELHLAVEGMALRRRAC